MGHWLEHERVETQSSCCGYAHAVRFAYPDVFLRPALEHVGDMAAVMNSDEQAPMETEPRVLG